MEWLHQPFAGEASSPRGSPTVSGAGGSSLSRKGQGTQKNSSGDREALGARCLSPVRKKTYTDLLKEIGLSLIPEGRFRKVR